MYINLMHDLYLYKLKLILILVYLIFLINFVVMSITFNNKQRILLFLKPFKKYLVNKLQTVIGKSI